MRRKENAEENRIEAFAWSHCFLSLIRFLWTTLSGNCTFGIGSTVTICVVHGIVLLTMGMIAVIERKQRKEEG